MNNGSAGVEIMNNETALKCVFFRRERGDAETF